MAMELGTHRVCPSTRAFEPDRAGLPLALSGVNLEVAPGERVGLVGRTGSGKSSLFQALLRMVEAEPPHTSSGRRTGTVAAIKIDGVVRSKLFPLPPLHFSCRSSRSEPWSTRT